jgi:predicted 2-oxoglutarate/Fe(II)-dependent dioxygenase YbiX
LIRKELLCGTEDIFLLRGFFSSEECQEHIARCEAVGFSDAPINSVSGPVVDKELRNNSRLIIDDFAAAFHLYLRAKNHLPRLFGEACGLNERFRYYRYEPGQYFNWHLDGAYKTSRLTFMVYLNDDFDGGTTDFHFGKEFCDVSVKPERGTALLFRHSVLHRGSPVVSGKKYVMRSDVIYPG